jgi:hypothetical protein
VESAVTLLWIELADGEREVLEKAAHDAGATMLRANREALAAHTWAALAVGGVVVVARTGREASTALGLGADEVVRLGEISRKAVGGAMDRARARAATRVLREIQPLVDDGIEHARSGHSPVHEPIGRRVAQTLEVLRLQLPVGIKLTVEMHGACTAPAPGLLVASTVTSLVLRAADALRDAAGPRAAIHVRVAEHQDTVVLEVEDGAGSAEGDLRPSLVEAFFATAPTQRTRLVGVRERLRRCGGDLVVDSDGSTTTVRVFFPTLSSELFREGGESADHALPGGTR